MDNDELTHKEYQEKYPEEFATIGGVLGEILLDRESGHDGIYALPQVTRFEIYGSGGGFKHAVTVEPGATLHIQDRGRTLKIFTKEHVEPGVWFQEEHDWGKRSTRDSSNSE